MRSVRGIGGAGLVVLAGALAACGGESEAGAAASSSGAAWLNEPLSAVRTSGELVAGPTAPAVRVENPVADDPNALAQGREIYQAFNCAGCHGGNGGGGIGPPFADQEWIYGSEPANIYATIVQGRPNGMPSFGHSITGDALWQLVAYVRSLSPEGEGDEDAEDRTQAGSDGETGRTGAPKSTTGG